MNLDTIFDQFNNNTISTVDKGHRFEDLIRNYLLTDTKYNFKEVYYWSEFPFKNDFGAHDIGIDLVALNNDDEYWAVQCKFHSENTFIDKSGLDSFLATSSKTFNNGLKFSHRLWVESNGKWNSKAQESIKNQVPPVSRITKTDLENSGIDWEKIFKGIYGQKALKTKKSLFPHQNEALENAHKYFKTKDRGKLIMACGTGKTLTALKIAEKETNNNGLVLFLVPSIALLGQTLNEWHSQSEKPIYSICICSDSKVTGSTVKEDNDLFDLPLPATTEIKSIKNRLEKALKNKNRGMIVVFSTYQSIAVISEAQKKIDNFEFDLIICDEAHRTTGVSLAEEDESSFIKVHNNDFIKSKKRLYMTATPRIYSDDSKVKAEKNEMTLCSMDDEKLYGEEIYRIGFGQAVENGLLSDYKVLILTISDNNINEALQTMLKNKNEEIDTDDISKLIGCINGLSKRIIGDDGLLKDKDPLPMKRAVAFCQSIKVSKKITDIFNNISKDYYNSLSDEVKKEIVNITSQHIDGTMNATVRSDLLSWLKRDEEKPEKENECKILTNVKCLSEGVDVPSLDAVLFLSAKNSQVDVVQSVGRVMRKSEGKKYGYIIIPIFVPISEDPNKVLDKNDKYKVVWTVLNALRAHDDRFNAVVNKIDLNKQKPDNIIVGQVQNDNDDVEVVKDSRMKNNIQHIMNFVEYQEAIYAKIVDKVGDRKYWEQWSKDIANIAVMYIERINNLISKDTKHKEEFDNFLNSLKININPTIDTDSAVEMLAQHMITLPVFEALFENYSFEKNNPVSKSMNNMIKLLEEQAFNKELKDLEKFYSSIKMRVKGIDNAEGKQKIILELYDKFFKAAFPKMVEKLGIVYTPLECVDFIIKSVNFILKEEFQSSISDEGVHIIDPFVGTGTFMTRLISNIDKNKLTYKYRNELYANEIILLAYYIASVNIENIYHDIVGGEYEHFEGICLTDTFQLSENTDIKYNKQNPFFKENNERLNKQIKAPIKVIIANPPYSKGQKSENDNAKNNSYPKLEERLRQTYVVNSSSSSNNRTYDSYIKAFRWASDRLEDRDGLIAFISNGSWLDGKSTDGFRKCLEEEFKKIYIVNLRGDSSGSGEIRKKEAGNVFGSGTKTPISIIFLIKNKKENKKAEIYYYDIGDYLSCEAKLNKLSEFESIENIKFKKIIPNKYGDYINKRGEDFKKFIPIDVTNEYDVNSKTFFIVRCQGITTNRDSYVYNFSKKQLLDNINITIDYYNNLLKTCQDKNNYKFEDSETNIKWTVRLKNNFKKNISIKTNIKNIITVLYRPFCKQNLYFSKDLIARPSLTEIFFPNTNCYNIIILCSGNGGKKKFSSFISNIMVDLNCLDAGTKVFPLYYYTHNKNNFLDDGVERHSAISKYIIDTASKKYNTKVSDEDIFYYVYGILHSPIYRQKYSNDLKKMLPHIPLLEKDLFFHFSNAGRKLAELHLNYENQKKLKEVLVSGEKSNNFKVSKMSFTDKNIKDRIFFNNDIVISNIPEKAYQYIINGKSAIEWIMERYQYKQDTDTLIINDPNKLDEGNSRYILDLLLSVITVSVKTVDIIENFPDHNFE
ncbi:type ISP restriction/modification enzyme [Brachyspira intermedia]|uniref:type ISP restriction/modification enzyme n=1 Tax=Brachyspira intermedia TaxID=84377 RepID=UPI003003EAB0